MPKLKEKERILKAAREQQLVTYKGAPIRLSADFSTETLQATRNWHRIFTVMKNMSLQPRVLYLFSKATIQNYWRDKVLPTQGKANGVNHYLASIKINAKGRNRRKKIKNMNNKMAKVHNSQ